MEAASVPARHFHDGTLLENLAQSYGDHFNGMGLQMPFRCVGATLVIFLASVSSGSEAVQFVLMAIAARMDARLVQ